MIEKLLSFFIAILRRKAFEETLISRFLSINEAIEKGLIEAPYKIPVTTWAKLLVRKIINDPLTRSTSKNLVSSIGSKRGLKLLKSKFIRETY